MDARDARLLLDAARSWSERGLLPRESLAVLDRELSPRAVAPLPAQEEGPGIGLSILYALAGVLLGAACIALPILLKVGDHAVPWWCLGLGLPVLALGLLLWRKGGPAGIVDALLVGALVPLVAMGLPDRAIGQWLSILSFACALLVVALPRASPTVPVVASVALFLSGGILAHSLLDRFRDTQASAWLWLALGLAQMAGTLAFAARKPWRAAVLALLCVGLVAPFVLAVDRALPFGDHVRADELLVGAFELALLCVGLALRQRGLVLGAALVVAVDAIAFAFATNVLLGILVLLGVAVALILLASTLKRGRRMPAPA
jgi:hypothetical protein